MTALLRESGKDNGILSLIGFIFYWDIVAGNIKTLELSIEAAETRLGWTVQ